MTARGTTALVARRELRERGRNRVFVVSTIVMLARVGASSFLAGALKPETVTYRIAVVAPVPPGLPPALQRAARPFDDAAVGVRVVDSAAAGRRELHAGNVDAVLLLPSSRLLFRTTVDPKLAAVADAAVRAIRQRAPVAPELTSQTIEPPASEPSDARVVTAMLGASLLLGAIAVYGQWVLIGVLEEKSNRVVELILSTVPARRLLAGKVIGIGLLGLAQLALVGGLAAILLATGAFDAPASLGGSVALVVPWFALGYALYAVAYAAAGALASRAEDVTSAGAPITYTLIGVFFLGYATLAASRDGILANVLTVFPLSAPLVLPARSALVGVPLWEHVLALLLVLATIYALVGFAGHVYAKGLLHMGARLHPRAAWRLARGA